MAADFLTGCIAALLGSGRRASGRGASLTVSCFAPGNAKRENGQPKRANHDLARLHWPASRRARYRRMNTYKKHAEGVIMVTKPRWHLAPFPCTLEIGDRRPAKLRLCAPDPDFTSSPSQESPSISIRPGSSSSASSAGPSSINTRRSIRNGPHNSTGVRALSPAFFSSAPSSSTKFATALSRVITKSKSRPSRSIFSVESPAANANPQRPFRNSTSPQPAPSQISFSLPFSMRLRSFSLTTA